MLRDFILDSCPEVIVSICANNLSLLSGSRFGHAGLSMPIITRTRNEYLLVVRQIKRGRILAQSIIVCFDSTHEEAHGFDSIPGAPFLSGFFEINPR